MKTTVGAFKKAWVSFCTTLCMAGGLTAEANVEGNLPWEAFEAEFRLRFGCDIKSIDTIPQDAEISGPLAEKLSAWLIWAGTIMGEGPFRSYLRECGLYP